MQATALQPLIRQTSQTMVRKHEPVDRFGATDRFGFLIFPNVYDCYACHYGVMFSHGALSGQAARYWQQWVPGQRPRFLPRSSQDWSAAIREAVEEALAASGAGFPFTVDLACPRCSAPVIICFEDVELGMARSGYLVVSVLSE